MNLFQQGEFVSHSGILLADKIDCDALTAADWAAVAAWFADRLWFREVVGVPAGGLKFAKAMQEYAELNENAPVLIVDDVLTTGRSMEEMRVRHPGAIGAVLFSRTRDVPGWILPRFTESAGG